MPIMYDLIVTCLMGFDLLLVKPDGLPKMIRCQVLTYLGNHCVILPLVHDGLNHLATGAKKPSIITYAALMYRCLLLGRVGRVCRITENLAALTCEGYFLLIDK